MLAVKGEDVELLGGTGGDAVAGEGRSTSQRFPQGRWLLRGGALGSVALAGVLMLALRHKVAAHFAVDASAMMEAAEEPNEKSCIETARAALKALNDKCDEAKEAELQVCEGKKKKEMCTSDAYETLNKCYAAGRACQIATHELCLDGTYDKKIEDIEECVPFELQKEIPVGDAVTPTDGATYVFFSLGGCPGSIRCNHGVSAEGSKPHQITIGRWKDSPTTLLKLEAAEKEGEFYIVNNFNCRFQGKYCGMKLAASYGRCPNWRKQNHDCNLLDFQKDSDKAVPFKVTAAPDKPDRFTFVSQLDCEKKGQWCGRFLATDTEDCRNQSPKLTLEDLGEEGQEHLWRLVASADEPEDVNIVSGGKYNFYTVSGCEKKQHCGRAWAGFSDWPEMWGHEFGKATPVRLEAAGKTDEFFIRNTYGCKSEQHTCNKTLVASSRSCSTDCKRAKFVAAGSDTATWKIEKVEGEKDYFTLKLQEKCPDGDTCDWNLAMSPGRRRRPVVVTKDDTWSVWRIEPAQDEL